MAGSTWTVRTRRLMAFPDLADDVAKRIVREEHLRRHQPAALAYLEGKVEHWSDSSKPVFKYEARRSTKVGGGVFIYIRVEGGPIQKLRWEQMDKGAPGGQNIVRKVTKFSPDPNYPKRKTGVQIIGGKKRSVGRPTKDGKRWKQGERQVVKGMPSGPLKSQVPYLAWNLYIPSERGKPGYFTAELRIRRTAPYTEWELHRDARRENRRKPAPLTRGPIRARNWTKMLREVYFGSPAQVDDPDLDNSALVGRNIARTAYSRWIRKIKESPLVDVG